MRNNQRYIDQNGITVIVPISQSKDKDRLKALLEEIGGDINNQDIIDFKSISTLHFGRWFIMDMVKDAEDKEMPAQLVFTSNFDGSTDDHLKELLNVAGEGVNKIYNFCEGYPSEGSENPKKVIAYLKKHSHKIPLLWPAIRGGTVQQIIGEGDLRDKIQEFLNEKAQKGELQNASEGDIKKEIASYIGNSEGLKWALTPRAKTSFGWKINYYGRLVGRLYLLLILLPFLIFLVPIWVGLLSRIFEKRDDRNRKDISRSKEFDALLRNEDQIFQNQLTVYGAIKKPYWFRVTTLKIGLWIFATNGKYRSSKGKLSGIETIHFARWTLFNKGKNVMFLSNYDGAWEIYLSEFIDRSAMAMNLTFGTTVGYPKVKHLLWGGAFDEQAFKTVVRNNQYPCQIFYSAYPYLTVKNILNNNGIRTGIDGSGTESVTEWLKRF